MPQSGWISYYIKGIDDDIQGAIELFQMQYERLTSYGKKVNNNNETLEKSNLTSSPTTITASLGEPM
jgi:hypothetical protein